VLGGFQSAILHAKRDWGSVEKGPPGRPALFLRSNLFHRFLAGAGAVARFLTYRMTIAGPPGWANVLAGDGKQPRLSVHHNRGFAIRNFVDPGFEHALAANALASLVGHLQALAVVAAADVDFVANFERGFGTGRDGGHENHGKEDSTTDCDSFPHRFFLSWRETPAEIALDNGSDRLPTDGDEHSRSSGEAENPRGSPA
jgi:hypothetical protein